MSKTLYINLYRSGGDSYDAVVYGYEEAAVKLQGDFAFIKTTVEIEDHQVNGGGK